MAIFQIIGWILLIIIWQILLKHIKFIWQKISIVYNLIYIRLISYLYNWKIYRKELLKIEIKDLCYNVVLTQNVGRQKENFDQVRWFISNLLWQDINEYIEQVDYLTSQYISLVRLRNLIILIWVALVISWIYFI